MVIKTQDTTNVFGHKLTVFENDHVSSKIIENGLYEKESLEFILSILKQIDEPVVFDVGANLGNHSLAYSTIARFVYAFEPLPVAYELLKNNLLQNQISNVKAFDLGLSDMNGVKKLHINNDRNYGTSSFYPRNNDTHKIHVTTIRGDNFVRDASIDKIDFIKMDIEGHEQAALEGLLETLNRFLPLLQIEWTFPKNTQDMKLSKIMSFLKKNYVFYVLGTNYDRAYWENKKASLFRRKIERLFYKRKAQLYPFNPDKVYKNLLLIPVNKSHLFQEMLEEQCSR